MSSFESIRGKWKDGGLVIDGINVNNRLKLFIVLLGQTPSKKYEVTPISV